MDTINTKDTGEVKVTSHYLYLKFDMDKSINLRVGTQTCSWQVSL